MSLLMAGVALVGLGVACGDDEKDAGDGGAAAGVGGAGPAGTGGSSGTAGTGGAPGAAGASAGSGGAAGSMTSDEDAGADVDAGPVVTPLPMDGEALSVCVADEDCTGDDLSCEVHGDYRGYCSPNCLEDADCAAVDGVESVCGADGRCSIDCGSGDAGAGECPERMVCAEIPADLLEDTRYRCQYPEPKDKREYERCDEQLGDSDCEGELVCSTFVSGLLSDFSLSYCTAGCAEDSDCSAVDSGGTPVCEFALPIDTEGRCSISCAEDDECPGDMACLTVDLVLGESRCGYAE